MTKYADAPTPEQDGEGNRSERARTSRRRQIGLAATLVALTAIAGFGAQVQGKSTATGTGLGTTDPNYSASGNGNVHFGARLDRASILAGGDGLVGMELTLAADARPEDRHARLATDLIVVLDRSGSMAGQPIEHARAAVRELIAQLEPQDRFGLVSYASDARMSIPLRPATDEARRRWQVDVAGIQANGGTNMSGGLDLAAATIEGLHSPGRVPRIILLSDGHANEGDASYAGLVARARRAVAGEYVLSTVGVGEGFDEALMTGLSDAGLGNFYYVQRSVELGEVFSGEFASARETVADALEVTLRPRPGVEILSAAGYPLESRDGVVRFRPGNLFAGQTRRIWVSLRVRSRGDGDVDALELGDFALAYGTPGDAHGERYTLQLSETPRIAQVATRERFVANVDKDAWEQSVVEEEFGALRQKVARSIRAKRPAAAIVSLREFKAEKEALNVDIGSGRVDEMIAELDRMEDDVKAAAESRDAAAANRLGKQYEAEGYDARRQGSKY